MVIQKKILENLVIPLLLTSLIIFLAFHYSLDINGMIRYRDFTYPYNEEHWKILERYLWDPYVQQPFSPFLLNRIIGNALSFTNPYVGEKILLVMPIVLLVILSYFIIKKLTNSVIAGVITAFISVFNPVIMTRVQHPRLLIASALMILLIYVYYEFVKHLPTMNIKTLIRYSMITSIILVFIIVSPHWLLYSAIFTLYFFIFYFCIYRFNRRYLVYGLLFILSSAIFTIICNPLLLLLVFNTVQGMEPSNIHFTAPYVFHYDVALLLSRNAELINTFLLQNYWWPADIYKVSFIDLGELQYLFIVLSRSMIPILAFISLLLKKRHSLLLLLATWSIIMIPLACGVKAPEPMAIYKAIIENSFIPLTLRALLRDCSKFDLLILPAYIIMIGFTIERIFNRIGHFTFCNLKILTLILFLVLIILNMFSAQALLTGNLAGRLMPFEKPNLYEEVDRFLLEANRPNYYFKVYTHPYIPPWYLDVPVVKHYTLPMIDLFLESLIKRNETQRMGSILSMEGVKYLVFYKTIDIPVLNANPTSFALILHKFEDSIEYNTYKTLLLQKDLSIVRESPYYTIFKNNVHKNYVYIPKSPLIAFNNLKILSSLASIYNLTDLALIPYPWCLDVLGTNFEYIVTSDVRDVIYPLVIHLSREKNVIVPAHFTFRYKPSEDWSRASLLDKLHGDWHSHLERMGIESWDLSYVDELAFTWSVSRLKKDVKLDEKDLIIQWDFTSLDDLDEWEKYTPEKQFGAYQKLELHDNALEIKLYNSTEGWKIIKSPLVSILYGEYFRFKFIIEAVNVQDLHVKIVEYDSNEKILNVHYMKTIGSGNVSRREIIIDFTPEDPKVRYVQLQLWHGHETKYTLPNIIRLDDVRIYDITKYTEAVTLDMPFNIEVGNRYVLLVQCFQSEKGGALEIVLDGERTVSLNTNSQVNKFAWNILGTFNLTKGQHRIILRNAKGFNAISVICLIPEHEYQEVMKEIGGILKEKKLVYIYEAENNLYGSKASELHMGSIASNGGVLLLKPESYLWNVLNLSVNGSYEILIRFKGHLIIKIGDYEFNITSSDLSFKYLGPINLSEGNYKIAIKSLEDSSYLDVIYIYPICDENSNPHNIFPLNNEVHLEYYNENPTSWIIEVNSTEPFMLAFCEAYDPSWTAVINEEETIKSMPLYSAINGFWINTSGLISIHITYKSQDIYEICLAMNAIMLLSYVICLIFIHKYKFLVSIVRTLKQRLRD